MIWNIRMECMEREELRKLQLRRLKRMVTRCYNNVPFYQNKLKELNVTPDDIQSLDDIQRLPFTYKQDLRDNYPFGLFAEPMHNIVRIHASSGTTGKPTTVGYTQHDLDVWSENAARSFGCAGATKHSVVQVSYGYGLFTGGLGLHYGAERMGCTVVPTSSGNTKRQLMLMQDYNADILCCTPSYALYLAESLQKEGVDSKSLMLKVGIFGAEPWTEGMRKEIEQMLDIDALDIYGLSEISGPGVAMECVEEKHGLHVWEDDYLIEIINPETGEHVKDGDVGELVISTISKEGIPLIRYRTRDLTAIIDAPCSCGRTHRRIERLKGRSDDMLIIRGVNIFPSQIEEALTRVEGIMPHYMIVVDRKDNLDTLEVQVELQPELYADEIRKLESLRKKIQAEIQTVIGIGADIRLSAAGSLPRSEGKAKRVIDNRILL